MGEMGWMSKYWTVKEVAEKFRVHPRTVRRWIREGSLTALCLAPRLNRGYRVTDASVTEFEVTRGYTRVHEDVSAR